MQKLPNCSHCFVCGYENKSGLKLRFVAEGGRVLTTFTPTEPQMGFKGITHGGILATILDETMGWAPVLLSGRFCVTLEMTVKYLRPLSVGTTVAVSGWVTHDRKRTWETAGEVIDGVGQVYARATGRYLRMSDKDSRNVLEYLTFEEGCIAADQLLSSSSN